MSGTTVQAPEWRLIEPGKWALDGTEITIRLWLGAGFYYAVHYRNNPLGGDRTLEGAKMKAAPIIAELQSAGIEP